MINAFFKFLVVLGYALFFTACGGVQSAVEVQPNGAVQLKQVTLFPTALKSSDQKPEVLALNEEWKRLADDELRRMLEAKKIIQVDHGPASVICHLEVVYGNRMLRYFSDLSTGGVGHVFATIELKDNAGSVRYSTRSEAGLEGGIFGGSVNDVVRKTIRAAVKDFGSRL
jgi:hypothetical protein